MLKTSPSELVFLCSVVNKAGGFKSEVQHRNF